MLKQWRYRWAMGVLTIIFFFAGVTVAVSTVGPIVRTVAAVVSLASAVLADRLMPSD